MFKKILITLIILYVFYSEIIISVTGIIVFKSILAYTTLLLFSAYCILGFKKINYKQFIILPIIFILVYLFVWKEVGDINLFYTVIFGWVLAQDFHFSKKILFVTFLIQSILTLYERITFSVIYETVVSGVLVKNSYDYSVSYGLFEITDFRAKGLFTGTLVGSSFIIYLTIFYRNNIKILILLFLSALIINGRLATVLVGFTLLLKLYKKYDKTILGKINFVYKQIIYFIPIAFVSLIFYLTASNLVWTNYLNTFDFNSMANAGRIYAYGESFYLYLSYTPLQKLFGLPGNEIFDVYGRLVASESGFISMFLDIGLIGFIYYLYYFILAYKSDKSSVLNLQSQYIGLKYVLLLTFIAFFQYEHINGNLRGTLFWFMIISIIYQSKNYKSQNIL